MIYSFCSRPKIGETENGDAVGIFGNETNRLFAVIDALGHGPEASEVSKRILSMISDMWEKSLEHIMFTCHKKLAGSRGAALFLARFHGAQSGILECTGVGNIECKTISNNTTPFSFNGIVGLHARKIHVFRIHYEENETYVFFTDGIHSRIDLKAFSALDVNSAAREILTRHGKDYDDATVLFIRT